MDATFAVVLLVITLALIFDFINGFHDAVNSIATVVSTRVLSPGKAVIWAAFFNFIAAFERLARVIALAEAVWGDAEAAREFLNRPHPLLERETPLAEAHTELGARRVESILYAIEHGLPL